MDNGKWKMSAKNLKNKPLKNSPLEGCPVGAGWKEKPIYPIRQGEKKK